MISNTFRHSTPSNSQHLGLRGGAAGAMEHDRIFTLSARTRACYLCVRARVRRFCARESSSAPRSAMQTTYTYTPTFCFIYINQGKSLTVIESARKANTYVRETSRAAINMTVVSPLARVRQGGADTASEAAWRCWLVFVLLMVAGALVAWGYWLYWGIWWIVKGRFQVTEGWAAAKCTIVRQRCYLDCSCCSSCDHPSRMFLSDNCMWLDKAKYARTAQGVIVRQDSSIPHIPSLPSSVPRTRMPALLAAGIPAISAALLSCCRDAPTAAIRLATLAALVAVASGRDSGSVSGEGDGRKRGSEGKWEGRDRWGHGRETGVRESVGGLKSSGDAGGGTLTDTHHVTHASHVSQDIASAGVLHRDLSGHRRKCACEKKPRIQVDFTIGAPCAQGDATCLAEFREPLVANRSFEHSCLVKADGAGKLRFCDDPAFMATAGCHGVQTCGSTGWVGKTCSTEEELLTPACDPARLNQAGTPVDCWLDPANDMVKFHAVEGDAPGLLAIVLWVLVTAGCCYCCLCS